MGNEALGFLYPRLRRFQAARGAARCSQRPTRSFSWPSSRRQNCTNGCKRTRTGTSQYPREINTARAKSVFCPFMAILPTVSAMGWFDSGSHIPSFNRVFTNDTNPLFRFAVMIRTARRKGNHPIGWNEGRVWLPTEAQRAIPQSKKKKGNHRDHREHREDLFSVRIHSFSVFSVISVVAPMRSQTPVLSHRPRFCENNKENRALPATCPPRGCPPCATVQITGVRAGSTLSELRGLPIIPPSLEMSLSRNRSDSREPFVVEIRILSSRPISGN